MTDREKVIRDLLEIRKDYEDMRCNVSVQIIDDAIALLKEQEAVEPKQVGLHGKEDWYGPVCVCPDCKAEWMSDDADIHFCPKCGRAVRWDA